MPKPEEISDKPNDPKAYETHDNMVYVVMIRDTGNKDSVGVAIKATVEREMATQYGQWLHEHNKKNEEYYIVCIKLDYDKNGVKPTLSETITF